ncbi:ribonuclease PH [Sulfobacillus thermotolerans]|uniref:Ribonuclease PH n=1 Tax=Sulfobacillus thermotolerans TaxID=338644 RepID=A0ABM6RP06_9FIRM|nr:ribonuclease PH [Sulfobacillus thermotolerans]
MVAIQRRDGRSNDAIRPVELQMGFNEWAEGSCLITAGHTRVLVTATVEDRVPPFVRGTGQGWISAEYGMLPRATNDRTFREATRGKQQGRTVEIQRLIGRSLRAAVNLKAMGEKSILLDCDVIQADGGTRTAAITAGFMALTQALLKIHKATPFTGKPLKDWTAAISVGLSMGEVYLDLDYHEDVQIGVDMNVVMTSQHQLIEIQGTAEHGLFSRQQLDLLLDFVEPGIDELVALERQALPEGALLIG